MVKQGTSGGECYGDGTGSGAGFTNSCIHSGSNTGSSGNTVWYNYVTATAGTTTGINNNIVSTESVCPKGWALPTTKQIDNQKDTSDFIATFSPVFGGDYNNSNLDNESTYGFWWGSEAYNQMERWLMAYTSSDFLYTNFHYRRTNGFYIRCVSEEKDVSDLTYMQDMTPSILQELCVIVNVLRA